MSRAEPSSGDPSPMAGERLFDADIVFLRRFTGPLLLLARASQLHFRTDRLHSLILFWFRPFRLRL